MAGLSAFVFDFLGVAFFGRAFDPAFVPCGSEDRVEMAAQESSISFERS